MWCFSMRSGVTSLFIMKQSCVALSTVKEEYVAACSTSYEEVWLRKLLFDLFYLQLEATCIFYDNQNYVRLSKNPMFHDKSKHIEIKYHCIRDMVQRGAVKNFHIVIVSFSLLIFIEPEILESISSTSY